MKDSKAKKAEQFKRDFKIKMEQTRKEDAVKVAEQNKIYKANENLYMNKRPADYPSRHMRNLTVREIGIGEPLNSKFIRNIPTPCFDWDTKHPYRKLVFIVERTTEELRDTIIKGQKEYTKNISRWIWTLVIEGEVLKEYPFLQCSDIDEICPGYVLFSNGFKYELGISAVATCKRDESFEPKSETQLISDPENTEILPGWNRNKLRLVSLPNGNTPAVLKYGNKPYRVPSGKAWDIVCSMIRENAFDGQCIEINTPYPAFKRYPLIKEILQCSRDKQYYLKTRETNTPK